MIMKHLDSEIVYLVLSILFCFSVAYKDLGDIGCKTEVTATMCDMGEVCSARCLYSCHNADTVKIWGTATYSYDSPICKSAVHDLRISTWNSSARNVILKRIPYYTLFYGSVRFGFSSIQYGSLSAWKLGSIYFLNSRISETILDVACVHQNYLYGPGEQHIQQCFIANDDTKRNLSFDVYSQRKLVPNVFNKEPAGITIGNITSYEMNWPSRLLENTSGGCQCMPEDSMLSIITSLAMRKDAYFLPEALTVTVNVGESVSIIMEEVEKQLLPTRWNKDFKSIAVHIPKRRSRTRLSFSDVPIGSAGIYSLEYATSDHNKTRRAITRLIVRACPEAHFGDNCTQACPSCQNGGICHDITGVCVCPPGFYGTVCEHACEPGAFGKTCDMFCMQVEDQFQKKESCKGMLICMPDPYGCSCAAGFKTLSCDVVCGPGEYGAGCSQQRHCHCASGDPCDIYSGLCHGPCAEGWQGPACVISYPLLLRKPKLLNATENSLTFEFVRWDASVDEGAGIPMSYSIVYREAHLNKSWDFGPSILPLNGTDNYIVTLEDLKEGTFYIVAVVVIDASGNMQLGNLSSVIESTLCYAPSSSPVNITISTAAVQVNVSWELPPRETWNCHSVDVWVLCETSEYSEEINVHDSFYIFLSNPFVTWNISVCLAPRNHDYASRTCSGVFTVTSEEDAPGQVKDIQYELLKSRGVKLTWQVPDKKNGIIRIYVIRYQQTAWLNECMLPTDKVVAEVNSSSTSVTLKSLLPSSQYSVNISAVTNKEGPSTVTTFETNMDVPDGVVTAFQYLEDASFLMWIAPLCNVTYGSITFYEAICIGQDVWDATVRKFTVTKSHLDLINLVPFTKYLVKVFVANKHGVSKKYSECSLKTKPAAPPRPMDLTVFSKTKSALSFSWLPPYPPYGELDHYSISCGTEKESTSRAVYPTDVVCPGSVRKYHHCYSFTNLKVDQNYKIRVQAFNIGVNTSSPTAVVYGETVETTPEAPNSVIIVNRTDTFVNLEWEEPFIMNGNLTGYQINTTVLKSFNSSISDVSIVVYVDDVHMHHYAFTKLTPATEYKSCIAASTSAGYGKSRCITFSTSNSKPEVSFTPLVLGQVKEDIVIKIFPVEAHGGPINAYFIIVDPVSKVRPKRQILQDFFEPNYCSTMGYPHLTKYVAAKIEDVPHEGLNFTVGEGSCRDGYYNAPLETEMMYKIGVAVLSIFEEEKKYSDIKYIPRPIIVTALPVERETHFAGAIFGFIVPFLVIIIFIIVFIYWKKPEYLYTNRRLRSIRLKILPKRDNEALFSSSIDALEEFGTDDEIDKIETESLAEEINNRIAVKDLETYVQQNLTNGSIRKEYWSLPRGQKFPYENAKICLNRVKNRYGNLLPYDHSRVVLDRVMSDPYSDYINANYVDGYKHVKNYIATQGPKQETVGDFWRMVWNENSCKILMVTNLTEGGKVKCAKYWPDQQEPTINPFDNFTIRFVEAESYADFVIRTFQISKNKESREVKQFHFQTWPDHSVPTYSSIVVSYLNKMHMYQPESAKPIIVHCSAGIGRTGTLILLHSMINMAKAEGYVDLLGHLNIMRRQRVNIVENLEQYIFVYNCLVETLCGVETCIPCTDFLPKLSLLRTTVLNSGKTPLENEFQILTKQKPSLAVSDTRNALKPENMSKNRDPSILPPDRARPILIMNALTEGSDYINAVFINGYRQKDAYLVTQYPLSNTIYDFWRMICENKSQTIVLLQEIDFTETDLSCYWPQENNVFVYEGFTVKCQSTSIADDVSVWNFALYPDSEVDGPPLLVSLYHLHMWKMTELCPKDPDFILMLLDQVEKRQQQVGTHVITVQCFDGATACGLFCATSFLCDKIKMEQNVDVFQAVKCVRMNRPEFIKEMEQYEFLYDIAMAYLEKFETYANFW